jgi:nucleoside-diphosphate-sugar epimerase
VTTLVTGASGHLGANLVRALLARGERVRALVRPGGDARGIEGLDVEWSPGDLTDPRALRAAVDGCDRVYHCAAFVSIRNLDRRRLFEVNVLGTRYLLAAARDAGVRKVVHCSSFGAVGRNPNGASNERWEIDPFAVELDYERSKAFAEIEVLRAAVQGQEVTIVNPSGIVGAWDFKPSMIGKTLQDFAHRRMRAYVPGAFDFVPVRDVVAGHLLAMEHGRRGERYLLTGEVATLEQVLRWWSTWLGRGGHPPLALSPRLITPLAELKDVVDRTLFPHKLPRFNRQSIRLLNSGKRGDNRKAQRELGLRPTALEAAFREQFDWMVARGAIPAPPGWVAAPTPALAWP